MAWFHAFSYYRQYRDGGDMPDMWEWKRAFLWKCYGGGMRPAGARHCGGGRVYLRTLEANCSEILWNAFWASQRFNFVQWSEGDGGQINTNLHVFLTLILYWVCGLRYYSYSWSVKQITYLENHSFQNINYRVIPRQMSNKLPGDHLRFSWKIYSRWIYVYTELFCKFFAYFHNSFWNKNF